MKRTSCKTTQRRLLDYAEGELSPADNTAVQRHLAACTACRDELQEIKNVRAALMRESVPDPGSEFWRQFPEQVWQSYAAQAGRARGTGLGASARRLYARLSQARRPAVWMPAFVALALLLGVALFFGLEKPAAPGIAAFQARVQSPEPHFRLAQRAGLELPDDRSYAFSTAAQPLNFFDVGHHYAAALAYADGDADNARRHLAALVASLGGLSNDSVEPAQKDPSRERIAALEARLARIAADAGADQAALFRAGGWLVNLALAIRARDRDALHDAMPRISQLTHDLDTANVAPGALRDLDALTQLLALPNPSDGDYASAAQLIHDIQLILK